MQPVSSAESSKGGSNGGRAALAPGQQRQRLPPWEGALPRSKGVRSLDLPSSRALPASSGPAAQPGYRRQLSGLSEQLRPEPEAQAQPRPRASSGGGTSESTEAQQGQPSSIAQALGRAWHMARYIAYAPVSLLHLARACQVQLWVLCLHTTLNCLRAIVARSEASLQKLERSRQPAAQAGPEAGGGAGSASPGAMCLDVRAVPGSHLEEPDAGALAAEAEPDVAEMGQRVMDPLCTCTGSSLAASVLGGDMSDLCSSGERSGSLGGASAASAAVLDYMAAGSTSSNMDGDLPGPATATAEEEEAGSQGPDATASQQEAVGEERLEELDSGSQAVDDSDMRAVDEDDEVPDVDRDSLGGGSDGEPLAGATPLPPDSIQAVQVDGEEEELGQHAGVADQDVEQAGRGPRDEEERHAELLLSEHAAAALCEGDLGDEVFSQHGSWQACSLDLQDLPPGVFSVVQAAVALNFSDELQLGVAPCSAAMFQPQMLMSQGRYLGGPGRGVKEEGSEYPAPSLRTNDSLNNGSMNSTFTVATSTTYNSRDYDALNLPDCEEAFYASPFDKPKPCRPAALSSGRVEPSSSCASTSPCLLGLPHTVERPVNWEPDSSLCVVCMERVREVGYLHAGTPATVHLATCRPCAWLAKNKDRLECPVCRQPVDSVVDVF